MMKDRPGKVVSADILIFFQICIMVVNLFSIPSVLVLLPGVNYLTSLCTRCVLYKTEMVILIALTSLGRIKQKAPGIEPDVTLSKH